jgi:hypothetical protein
MKSPLVVIIIVVFLLLGGLSVAIPAVGSVFSYNLNNNDTTTKIWAGNSGASINTAESLSVGPNPTGNEIWTPGATSVYVISVPKGSLFSQTIIPQLQYSSPNKPGLSDLTNWYITGQLYYDYAPYNNQTDSFSSAYQITYANISASGIFDNGQGNIAINPGAFPVEWNASQPNINAAFGILTLKVNYIFEVETSIEGSISNVFWGTASTLAQIYVLPGTSTINPVNTVFAGKPVYITGTTWWGDYSLTIKNPSGVVVDNITLPSDRGYNVSWVTPTGVYGEYTVEVFNYIVQTSSEQFFSVAKYPYTSSGYLPAPKISVSQPQTVSGVYKIGEAVTYTISESLPANDTSAYTLFFNVNIWIGSKNQEPATTSAEWITTNLNATGANVGNGHYSYTGSFTIEALASNNFITIDVVAVMLSQNSSTGATWYASQPVLTTLSVGLPTYIVPGSMMLYYLEIIGFVFAGLVAAYLVPADILSKGAIVGSAVFSALMVYMFNIVHLFGM